MPDHSCVGWFAMLFAAGMGIGLGALQAMLISTGLPFTLILLVLCMGIIHGLRGEKRA